MDAPLSWRGQPPQTPPAERGDTPRAPRLSHVHFKLVAKAKDSRAHASHTPTVLHTSVIAQRRRPRACSVECQLRGAAAGLQAAAQRGGGCKRLAGICSSCAGHHHRSCCHPPHARNERISGVTCTVAHVASTCDATSARARQSRAGPDEPSSSVVGELVGLFSSRPESVAGQKGAGAGGPARYTRAVGLARNRATDQ